jgi:hypothetical protein
MKRIAVTLSMLVIGIGVMLGLAWAGTESKPSSLQPKEEWFVPVTVTLHGIKTSGFIYNGPGTFVTQQQFWSQQQPPVNKTHDDPKPSESKLDKNDFKWEPKPITK